MKKLLLTIATLTLGLSIISVHGAERKRNSDEIEKPSAAKKQKAEARVDDEITRQLLKAIEQLNIDKVVDALNRGANPNGWTTDSSITNLAEIDDFKNPKKYHLPRGMSVENGITAIFQILIDRGANPNLTVEHDKKSLLARLFAYPLSSHLVEALIESGANVNQASLEGVTPLMEAAKRNRSKDLEVLLRHGANIGAVDNKGHDVMYYIKKSIIRKPREEMLKVIEPYEKAHREATKKAVEAYLPAVLADLTADYTTGEDLEQKAIRAKKEPTNMDED